MKITIDLPKLWLEDVKYEDETFKHNSYYIRKPSNDVLAFEDYFKTLETVFFQDEATIDIDILNELSINVDIFTTEILNLLYENVEKAYAMYKGLKYEYNFHDIVEIDYGINEPNVYDIDGAEYMAYYEDELMIDARGLLSGYLDDSSLTDILGDAHTILNDYNHLINLPALKQELIKYGEENDLSILQDADEMDCINDFIDNYDDDATTVLELIENNNLFNSIQYAEDTIDSVGPAIEEVSNNLGSYLGKFLADLTDRKTQNVYIFERF